MHHQRTGLWPALVYAGCVGMANACYPSCWPVRICGLVNYSHPSSTKLAEACVCRSSSSDSPTARDRVSPTIAVAATSRQTATEFFADIAAARREEAGFGIGARVMQALFLPVVALSFAAAPVVGQNFGGRRADRVRHSVYPVIGIASLMTLVLTLIVAYTDCAFCTCNPDSHFLTRRASDCLRQRLPADRFIEFHLGRNRFYIVKCVSRNRQHTAASV